MITLCHNKLYYIRCTKHTLVIKDCFMFGKYYKSSTYTIMSVVDQMNG